MTTVNELLFGRQGAAHGTLVKAMNDRRVEYEKVAVSGTIVDDPKVAGAVVDVLDVRLSSFAARGWLDYQQIQKAIERTRVNAPDRDSVGLARHTIKTKHPIAVEVDVAGVTRKVFECDLLLEFEVDPVNVLVINGHLGPLRAQARVKGSLKFGEAKLVERELQEVTLELREEQIEPPQHPSTIDLRNETKARPQ